MPCNNLRGQLSLYASGDLEHDKAVIVREHLKNCPSCRYSVQSFEKTRSVLGSYAQQMRRAPEAPGLWSGVMGRLNQKAPRGRTPPGPQA